MTQLNKGFLKDILICINLFAKKKNNNKKNSETSLQYVDFRNNALLKTIKLLGPLKIV